MELKERLHAYEKIIIHFGSKEQMEVAIEEMAELTKEIIKYFRSFQKGKCYDFLDLYQEIADVSVMIEQLNYLFNCKDKVDEIKADKIKRTLAKIEEERRLKNGKH